MWRRARLVGSAAMCVHGSFIMRVAVVDHRRSCVDNMVVDGIVMEKGLWNRYVRGYNCCVACSSVPDNARRRIQCTRQDKKQCAQKTAAKQAIQGSGRVGVCTMLWDDVEPVVGWSRGSA